MKNGALNSRAQLINNLYFMSKRYYQVQAILEQRVGSGMRQVLVQWSGKKKSTSWVPVQNLNNSIEFLIRFIKRKCSKTMCQNCRVPFEDIVRSQEAEIDKGCPPKGLKSKRGSPVQSSRQQQNVEGRKIRKMSESMQVQKQEQSQILQKYSLISKEKAPLSIEKKLKQMKIQLESKKVNNCTQNQQQKQANTPPQPTKIQTKKQKMIKLQELQKQFSSKSQPLGVSPQNKIVQPNHLNKIFIARISHLASDQQIIRLIQTTAEGVKIKLPNQGGKRKGFAFAEYQSQLQAKEAIEMLNQYLTAFQF